MSPLYYVSVTIHVLAAMLWLGGMFFLGVVGAPLLRGLEPILRQQVFQQLGQRFRLVGWAAILVLIGTGAANLYYRGWLHWDGVLGDAAFWRTPTGIVLSAKLAGVAVMIVVSALHDFVFGPLAGNAEPGSRQSASLRRWAALLARINAMAGIIVVAAAVLLVRGG